MRIAIIGNSGSGKSTLANQLASADALNVLDLDTVAWEPGKVAVPRDREAAAADVIALCRAHESWVVEGCYARLVSHALEYMPILLFKDPGVDACLSNCRSRPWEPHKYASKEEQDEDLSLAAHQKLFDAYRGPKLRLANADRSFIEHLGARFEAQAIPANEWTHAAHLVVGLWHVQRYGQDEALARLRSGICRLNESHGGVNSDTDGYHETITAAYVQLIAQYLGSGPADTPLDLRGMRLLSSPLAAGGVLFTFYTRERLMSTSARRAWVEPDRAPLDSALSLVAPGATLRI